MSLPISSASKPDARLCRFNGSVTTLNVFLQCDANLLQIRSNPVQRDGAERAEAPREPNHREIPRRQIGRHRRRIWRVCCPDLLHHHRRSRSRGDRSAKNIQHGRVIALNPPRCRPAKNRDGPRGSPRSAIDRPRRIVHPSGVVSRGEKRRSPHGIRQAADTEGGQIRMACNAVCRARSCFCIANNCRRHEPLRSARSCQLHHAHG